MSSHDCEKGDWALMGIIFGELGGSGWEFSRKRYVGGLFEVIGGRWVWLGLDKSLKVKAK